MPHQHLQPELNHQLNLLSEAQQQATLAQLAELLKNSWFLHFNATWTLERDRARAAVCDFPIRDFATTVTALQTRGEAVAYDAVVTGPYDLYNQLVADIQERERENERRAAGDTNGGPDDFTVA
jgi:hypothetical protein